MKKISALILFAGFSTILLTGCGKEESQTPMPAMTPTSQPATTQPQAQAHFDNTLCPVSKHAISGKGMAVEFNGKTYGFCCDDCVETFKANPAKYLAAAQ